MDEAVQYVGAKELAEWLNLTTRRISQLVHEGVLPRESRGRYPVKRCVQAYTRFVDKMMLKKGTGSELNEEKLLTVRLHRKREELKFAKAEGSLITVDDHERVMATAFAIVRTNIRNLPGALAPRLAGIDDPRDVEAILVPALDDSLRAIVDAGRKMASDALPEDTPGRKALIKAGVTTMSEVAAFSDLTVIPGIGPKVAVKIRKWVGAA